MRTQHYDLGFYIGLDGMRGLTGTCTVAIVPPALGDEDMDACGDHARGSALGRTALAHPPLLG